MRLRQPNLRVQFNDLKVDLSKVKLDEHSVPNSAVTPILSQSCKSKEWVVGDCASHADPNESLPGKTASELDQFHSPVSCKPQKHLDRHEEKYSPQAARVFN